MPELPEVETTRRHIMPYLIGRQISHVVTTCDNHFFLTSPDRLRKHLPGRCVVSIDRRGKYLFAELSDGRGLLVHLGMTGQLFTSDVANTRLFLKKVRSSFGERGAVYFKPDVHTHLQISFMDQGPRVFLRDVRKFGKVLLLDPNEQHPRLSRLGVDALEVSGVDLFRATRGRKSHIKTLLLDQSVIAGVGNIYADEALFRSGVRPTCRALRVNRRQCDLLVQKLRQVLERSIELGGSSISDYLSPDGSDGTYQNQYCVYGRTGKSCRVCQTIIKRCMVAGRSTHYCPQCQSSKS